jgi:hypothetical protein
MDTVDKIWVTGLLIVLLTFLGVSLYAMGVLAEVIK